MMKKAEPEEIVAWIIRNLKSQKPEDRIRIFEAVQAYFHEPNNR